MAASPAPISWKALFVEAFFIVFSVLLALGVNEWRAERQNAQMGEAALEAIAGELDANRQFLASRLPYYEAMRDSLRSRMGTPFESLENLPGWRGMAPPLLRDASYQAALATNAFVYIDFRSADAVSQVYALQSILTSIIDKYATAFVTTDMRDYRRLLIMFSEMASIGGEVQQAYEQVLTVLPPPPEDRDALIQ